MVRDAVRQFVDNEIRPHREELEHGDLPPYDLLRKLYSTFGMDQLARDSFKKRIEAEKLEASGKAPAAADSESRNDNHPGWKRGIRIGSAKDGSVTAYIPDTEPDSDHHPNSAAEGVAADAKGNLYGAEVGAKDVKKNPEL